MKEIEKFVNAIKEILHIGIEKRDMATFSIEEVAKNLYKTRIETVLLFLRESITEKVIVDDQPLLECQRLITWKKELVDVVGASYGCAKKIIKGHRHTQVKLIGVESDIEVVRSMVIWFMIYIGNKSKIESKGKGLIWSNSWAGGYVTGIKKQLELAERRAIEEIRKESKENIDSAIDILNKRIIIAKSITQEEDMGSKSKIDIKAFNKGVSDGSE